MLKCYLLKMFFLFMAMLSGVAFCFAADPIVSVSIRLENITVKVKESDAAEDIGKNTAKYTISGSCDPSSLKTKEVKPVESAWTCSCSEITFIPPANVQAEPSSQGNPSLSVFEGTNSWTTKVSSPYTSQSSLTLTIPKDGTVDFYVSGETESTKTDDVLILATSGMGIDG